MPLPTSWFWTWEKKKMIHPSSWEDRSSTPPMRSSKSDLDNYISNSLEKRYVVISIVILLMSSWRRTALGGDVYHLDVKGTNPDGMNGKIKNMKHLWKMNLPRLRQVHSLGRCGKKRWHHHRNHHHKMCSHLGHHHWDRMMHPRYEGLLPSQVMSRGLKNPNPHREVTTVVIHIYFLALHKLFLTLAYLLLCIYIVLVKER